MDSPSLSSKSGIPSALRSHLNAQGEKKIYPRDSVRLFRQDWLEALTHVHPIVPLLMWVPVIVALIYRSFVLHQLGWGEVAALGVSALLVWTLVEYVLHRFVFHYPAKSPFGRRIVYIMHGLHHEDPQDPTRLVMPPVPAILYTLMFYGLFYLVVGPKYVEAFIAFFLLGYLAYDYTHYAVHHFQPKDRIGKYLKRYHLLHHYADYESRWGVSNPLWDYVFGTMGERSKAPSSRTGTV